MEQQLPLWRRQAERGSPALMWLLTKVALLFGRNAARVFLPAICLYFIVFSIRARRASRAYLTRALGRPARFSDVYAHYLCFSTTLLDRVFWMSGQIANYAVDVVGAEYVHAALKGGNGCLLVGAHFGSFELTRVLASHVPGMHIDVLMQPHHARKLGATLRTLGAQPTHQVIALGEADTMLKVRDALRAGHGVGLLADRSTIATDTLACDFLGAPAAFARGPFKLAAALAAPVVLFRSVWLGALRYRVEFVALEAGDDPIRYTDVDTAVSRYAAWLEVACRAQPFNWFNFYDFWKLAGDGA